MPAEPFPLWRDYRESRSRADAILDRLDAGRERRERMVDDAIRRADAKFARLRPALERRRCA